MKSNIGFLQVLTFILVILDALRFVNINIFLMVFIIIIAWFDSYYRADLGGGE